MLTHRNLAANAAQGRAWVPGLVRGRGGRLRRAADVPRLRTDAVPDLRDEHGRATGALPEVRRRPAAGRCQETPPRRSSLPCHRSTSSSHRRLGRRAWTCHRLRFAISGAMPLPTVTLELWESVTGGLLIEGYGLTESSPVAVGNPIGLARRPGAVGVPFPSTEIRVVDPDAPARRTGRPASAASCSSAVRRCSPATGANPRRPRRPSSTAAGCARATSSRSTATGSSRSSTASRRSSSPGGFNVMPSEVEAALRHYPGVTEAAVVGLPRADGSEEVVAAVMVEDRERARSPRPRASTAASTSRPTRCRGASRWSRSCRARDHRQGAAAPQVRDDLLAR